VPFLGEDDGDCDIGDMKQGNIAAIQGTRHNESDQRTKGTPTSALK